MIRCKLNFEIDLTNLLVFVKDWKPIVLEIWFVIEIVENYFSFRSNQTVNWNKCTSNVVIVQNVFVVHFNKEYVVVARSRDQSVVLNIKPLRVCNCDFFVPDWCLTSLIMYFRYVLKFMFMFVQVKLVFSWFICFIRNLWIFKYEIRVLVPN